MTNDTNEPPPKNNTKFANNQRNSLTEQMVKDTSLSHFQKM